MTKPLVTKHKRREVGRDPAVDEHPPLRPLLPIGVEDSRLERKGNRGRGHDRLRDSRLGRQRSVEDGQVPGAQVYRDDEEIDPRSGGQGREGRPTLVDLQPQPLRLTAEDLREPFQDPLVVEKTGTPAQAAVAAPAGRPSQRRQPRLFLVPDLRRRHPGRDHGSRDRTGRRARDRLEPELPSQHALERAGVEDALCAAALEDAVDEPFNPRRVEPPALALRPMRPR